MNPKPLEISKLASHLLPWDNNENVIWLASTLCLYRNIEKFKFPIKLEVERKKQILALIARAILQVKELKNPFDIKAEDLQPLEKEFLQEHFLIFEGFQEARQGEGFILDDTGEFIALLNLKDHIRLQFTDITGDLEKTWAKLVSLECELNPDLNFAFSQKFGFLTSDPAHAGTGLLISAYLHLPALIHQGQLGELIEQEKGQAVLCTGLQGIPEDYIGDIVTVRNAYVLGVNEENIISTLRNAILKFLIAEKSMRSKLKTEGAPTLKDKISRALGTLKFSYQLETVEALSAISYVKLGIEMGWVKGLTVQQVNKLLFTCRRAHLNYVLKEKISIDDAASKRAEYLRAQVASAQCDFST